MFQYDCCGVDAYTEWEDSNNAYLEDMGYKVPASCCKEKDDTNCQENPNNDNGHLDSCYTKFENAVTNHANLILAVAIVVVVIMVRESLRFTSIHLATIGE